MAKEVTLADIAREVGVSSVTVSKALAGKSGVSDGLRQRIKIVAKKRNYEYIGNSKVEKKGTGNLGVLISKNLLEYNSTFYWNLYQHTVTSAAERGYYIILEILEAKMEQEHVIPQMVQNDKIDGIVIIGQLMNHYIDFILKTTEIPIIFLDSYDLDMEYDTVITNGYYGMYMLTSHFIKLGHSNIGFIGAGLPASDIQDHHFGFCKAMIEHGIPIKDEWVLVDPYNDNKYLADPMLPDKLPTAFLCSCNQMAGVILKLLNERGLSVPEDISVGGFGDYKKEELENLKLTAYCSGIDRMAGICIDTLIKKINKHEYIEGLQIVTGRLMSNEQKRE